MTVKTFAAIDVGSFELELGIFEISASAGIREIDHLTPEKPMPAGAPIE